MPLLDHFHPPLHGPRRWEGFHHSWAAYIAAQLNQETLPPEYFAQLEINWGHELNMNRFEIWVCQDLGGAELRGAIELISPANKDRAGSRRTFAARCAGYLQHGIGVIMIDIVTARSANLHQELCGVLEVKSRHASWASPSGLYAVAYRLVTVRKNPRIEVWPEALKLGKAIPVLPLWLSLELCEPVRLEESYTETCQSLRLPA